jgi:hypothetical protein
MSMASGDDPFKAVERSKASMTNGKGRPGVAG